MALPRSISAVHAISMSISVCYLAAVTALSAITTRYGISRFIGLGEKKL
jgi:hypothetical protein